VLDLNAKVVIGIDLAGKPENPTGIAFLENRKVRTKVLYKDDEILEALYQKSPKLVAIDSPFSLPKTGTIREAERAMIKSGYRVFPPTLPAMRVLTLRAIKLNSILLQKGLKTIEVHPTSTCKALSIPPKDWRKIQTILAQIGFRGDVEARTLTSHEVDATLAALTAYLHAKKQTDAFGNKEEGYIIVPKKQEWRALHV
jgi:predicted nuclease with RNAse H fold